MSKFTATVKQDTPRLVVEYKTDGEREGFGWGIVGTVPMLSLIGFLCKVQSDIQFRSPDHCDQSALVITWDSDTKKFSWYLNKSIPVDPLVGMLETVKAGLVAAQLAQQVAAQQAAKHTGLIGIDGRPILRGN